MSRKSVIPKTRRHIMVFDEDWEWIITHYGMSGPTRLGAGEACCEIIHHRVKAMRAREIERRDGIPMRNPDNEESCEGALLK